MLAKEQESLNAKYAHAQNLLNEVNKGEKKIENLDEELGKIPGLIKQARKAFNQKTKGVYIGFNILGVFEYNFKHDEIQNFELNVGASVGVKVSGAFMAWVIPMFYEVSAGFEVSVKFKIVNNGHKMMTLEEFLSNIFTELAIKGRAEIGVGVNDVLGLSVYAELKGGVRLYPLATGEAILGFGDNKVIVDDYPYILNVASWGYFLDWRVALRLEVLIFDFELGYEGGIEKPEFLPNHVVKRDEEEKSVVDLESMQPLSYMNRSIRFSEKDRTDFTNVYQNSKPQLVQINGKNMLIWIEDTPYRDNYNRTVLKYSVYENNQWCEPKRGV